MKVEEFLRDSGEKHEKEKRKWYLNDIGHTCEWLAHIWWRYLGMRRRCGSVGGAMSLRGELWSFENPNHSNSLSPLHSSSIPLASFSPSLSRSSLSPSFPLFLSCFLCLLYVVSKCQLLVITLESCLLALSHAITLMVVMDSPSESVSKSPAKFFYGLPWS